MSDLKRLTGRVALVTGAGDGIGAAIARRLAAEGAPVHVTGRWEENTRATTDTIIASGGQANWSIESDWEEWPAPVVRIKPASSASWEPHTVQVALMNGDPPVNVDVFKGELLVSTRCLRPGDEFEIARQLSPLLAT